jgi:hypothetical protein
MLVDIALMILVFAFAALVLVGHVLVLAALTEPGPHDAERLDTEAGLKPEKLALRLISS